MLGTHLIELPHTPSTNSYLHELMRQDANLAEGTLVCALDQSKGRGQIGNTWESEAGKNLTLSYFLRPTFLRPDAQFALSMAVSLGLADLVADYADRASIKWPNDIYIDDRKVAGILIENSLRGPVLHSSIVGIGLNVNQTVFRGDAPNPVSLAQMIGAELELPSVLRQLMEHQNHYLSLLRNNDWVSLKQAYLDRLFRFDAWADYEADGVRFTGRIVDVEPSGRLMLETGSGKLRGFMFKEVSFCF